MEGGREGGGGMSVAHLKKKCAGSNLYIGLHYEISMVFGSNQ